MGKPKLLFQILIDAHGVAPERYLALDPLAVDLARRGGGHRLRSRWPGWGILLGIGGFRRLFRTNPGGHPGGFCFSLDATDRLAIHPEHPRNLALGFACIQQGLDRNPQIKLQDVHSRPLFRKKDLA